MKLSKMYNKYYMSKSSIIFILISILILSLYSFIYLIQSKNNYNFYYKTYNNNYFNNSFNILIVIIIFILSLLYLKEANLIETSLNVIFESIYGREKVFLAKQISILSTTICLVSTYYFILFIPPLYLYNMFKIDFLINYLVLLVFSLEIIELNLFFNYLFKNYIVSSTITLLILINNFLNNRFLDYLIPNVKINDFLIEYNNIYYTFLYISIVLSFNYLFYIKLDRK